MPWASPPTSPSFFQRPLDVFLRAVAVAAVFSTASAINATLYGGANTSYMVDKDGELPEIFKRKSWKGCPDGLFITTGLVIAMILCLGMFGLLSVYTFEQSKPSFTAMFVVLALSFLLEWGYRKISRRSLHTLFRSPAG